MPDTEVMGGPPLQSVRSDTGGLNYGTQGNIWRTFQHQMLPGVPSSLLLFFTLTNS
jgi:hypothetical protein